MSDGITTSTILGVAQPDQLNLDPKRVKLYWETFIEKGGLEKKLGQNIELPDPNDPSDIEDFMLNFESDNSQNYGLFAFMQWVINNTDSTAALPIEYANTETENVLGVFEITDYPWNMQQYVDDAKENNITRKRIEETLKQHYYIMFQKEPIIEEYDLEFFV